MATLQDAERTGRSEHNPVVRALSCVFHARARLIRVLLLALLPAVGQSQEPVFFSYQIGGPVPLPQMYSITSGIPVGLALRTDGANWVSASLSSNMTPAILTIAVNPIGLAAGTYTPAPQPVGQLLVGPTSLAFTVKVGDVSAIPQSISAMSTGGAITYVVSASINTGWLSVIGSSLTGGGAWTGTTPGTVSVFVSPGGLQAGTYTGTVTFTSNLATNSPVVVPVTLIVNPPDPIILSASLNSLSFSYQQGGPAVAPERLSISSSGRAVVFSVVSSAGWLSVDPTVGVTPSALTVSVSPTGLAPGAYTGSISITGQGASNSLQIPVSLTIRTGPVIALSRNQLSFSFEMGGPVPPSQTVTVSNAGGGTLGWTASSSAPWLVVSPASGTAPFSLATTVNPWNLAAGTYRGTVMVSASGAASQVITVTLTVTAPAPSIGAIVNAASFRAGMVPGGLATLFGKNLSLAAGAEFPGGATSYKGLTLTVDGHRVPLLALSNVGGQEQISFQVPFELGTPALARVEVNSGGRIAALQNVPVLRAQPGVFEYTPPGSGVRHAAAVKPDGSVVGPANPVSPGEPVSIFLTGMGPVLPVVLTGQPGPANPLAVTWLQPTVGIGGIGAEVLFSGYAPGFLGLYQINVVIPYSAPSGLVNLDVVVDGVPSQTSKIAVR